MSLISANIRCGLCAISAERLTSFIGKIVPQMSQTKPEPKLIAENRNEAGMVLHGWEVKSMRAGKANLTESYVYVKNGEAFLYGAHLAPLNTTSTHFVAEPTRTRKLLLNRSELEQLEDAVERSGYTLVPLEMYWKAGRAKLRIGIAKGKKQHDKRATEKDRDWQRDKARIMRTR